jgi:hypothetical protein
MRAVFIVIVLLGFKPAGQAQGVVPVLVTLGLNLASLSETEKFFYRSGKGSYQVEDAEWQTDHVAINNELIAVGRGREPRTYYLNQVQHVVLGIDTFSTVHNVAVWGQPQAAPLLIIGRRTWRRPQAELFLVTAGGGTVPVVRFPDQAAIALPVRKRDFQQAMLALVGDHPILAEQLRAGQLDASYTKQILEVYLRWKPAGFDTTALFAPATPAKAK